MRSFRTSARQLLKHAQVMAVVSGFTIGWPIDVDHVWKALGVFNLRIVSIAGFACLTGEQTASLELYVRWAMPLAFAFIGVVLAPLMLAPVALALTKCSSSKRLRRVGKSLRMRWHHSSKAVFWLLLLVFPTLLHFGFMLFTCNRHPNDEMTVAFYPHLHCIGSRSGADNEWLQLVPAGLVYNFMFLGGILAYYVTVLRQTVEEMQASSFARRGAHFIFFEDFRDPAVHWPLILVGRDLMVNIARTVFNNYGTLQLLFTGLCSLCLAGKVAAEWPYVDASNNVLEMINAMSIFTVCIFTAGMGFAEEPGVESMAKMIKGEDGRDVMAVRSAILLVFQLLSLFGPVTVVAYQVLLLFPCIERRMPASMRPLRPEEEDQLWAAVVDSLVHGGAHEKTRNFETVVAKLDSAEVHHLSAFLLRAPATLGIMREHQEKKSVQELIKRSRSSTSNSTSRDVGQREGSGSEIGFDALQKQPGKAPSQQLEEEDELVEGYSLLPPEAQSRFRRRLGLRERLPEEADQKPVKEQDGVNHNRSEQVTVWSVVDL